MSNNPNNPNNPYNMHSQWNPFQASSPNSTSPNSSNVPYHMYPTQIPQTQFSQPPPNYPDDYNDFLMWRNAQQHTQNTQSQPQNTQSQPDIRFVEDEVPNPTSTRRKARGKGKKVAGEESSQPRPKKVIANSTFWEPEDELRLAKSWIAVSEDSNRGNAQTGASFWYQVIEEYNGRKPPYIRNKDALTSKWRKLNSNCQKFGGIVSRLQKEWRSGENDNDFRMRCESQYRLENLKPFTNYVAWDFLKDQQKWLNPDPVVVGRRNAKRPEPVDLDSDEEREEEAEDNPNADLFGPDPFSRPPGKERRKTQKTSSGSAASSRASFEDSVTSTFSGIREDKQAYYKRKDLETQLRILQIRTDDLPEADRQVIEMQKAMIRASLTSPGGGSGSGSDV